MAGFEVDLSGINDLTKFLDANGLFSEEIQSEMLSAGADHVQSCIKSQASQSPHQMSRIVSKLSKSKKIKKDKNGNYYMSVTISGKNERGERNATVAFVLNYGRSKKFGKIDGSYFWTRGAKRAKDTILPVYENVVNKELKERGLI